MKDPAPGKVSRMVVFLASCLCCFQLSAVRADTWYADDDAADDPAPGDTALSDPAEDGSLEHPFDAIQEAIDAASDDETVVVLDGTYTGEGNRDIQFTGKAIHLRSENGPESCIIDCQGSEQEYHRGFHLHAGETERSIVEGFTITNGYAAGGSSENVGGGIFCDNSSPTITRNVITGNRADGGGGIFCVHDSDSTIINNTISGNTGTQGGGIACWVSAPHIAGNTISGNTAQDGGGVFCGSGSSPKIYNNVIIDNGADSAGGGVCCHADSAAISNNTVAGNTASAGGGIHSAGFSSATIENCVLWDNGDDLSGCTATYSCVEDGDAGAGNTSADPRFAHAAAGDYHLKSMHGRWDPAANAGEGGWVYDDVTSPCIDGGDPGSAFADEPVPNGGRVNMGAYGNTPQASRSSSNLAGDANNDCNVNITDMIFIRNRMNRDPMTEDNWRADVNSDGRINILDLMTVRNNLNKRCD